MTMPTPPPASAQSPRPAAPVQPITHAIDPLFLAAPHVSTYLGEFALTNASGFFFEREDRLYLVTSRHVVIDEASGHLPDRLMIELHLDATNLTRSTGFSVPLYGDGVALWHQGRDSEGEIDVAVIELDRAALPPSAVYRAFTPEHIHSAFGTVPADASLMIVGFPLGFHDAVHHLPVVRLAAIASPLGIRFQGQGYFLTDARTHRGTSGAAVVMRDPMPASIAAQALPWRLLGVHSSRMDMGNRDLVLDESLGLNCAWYANILLTLTKARA